EYQRADCAPRSTLGNGAITVTDWVQAGRYAARLDPLVAVGGPTNDSTSFAAGLDSDPKGASARRVDVTNNVLAQNQSGTVSVNLEAQGNENALGFSVSFDPSKLTYVGASLGAGASGATLNVNSGHAT